MKTAESMLSVKLLSHLLSGIVLTCAGCWEEVQYNPSKPAEVVLSDTEDSPADVTATSLFSPTEDSLTSADESIEESTPLDEATPSNFVDFRPHGSEAATAATPLPADMEFSSSESTIEEIVSAKTDSQSLEPASLDRDVLRPSRTALAAWRMSSRWSLAAAIYAKGQPEDRYRDVLDQAAYAGDLVGIALPSFPASESGDLQSAVIGYLLEEGSTQFTEPLGEQYDPRYGALSELAIKTNTLLLVYTPKSQQLDPVVASIRQSAEDSGLPREYWDGVVAMLEDRAPYGEVKQKVLAMHAEVGDYLSGSEE